MLGLRVLHLVLSSLLIGPTLADVINLASLKWTLNSANGTISIPSTGPPCQAHIDLLNAGIITEPLLGTNGTS
jgi:beta-mannosidase